METKSSKKRGVEGNKTEMVQKEKNEKKKKSVPKKSTSKSSSDSTSSYSSVQKKEKITTKEKHKHPKKDVVMEEPKQKSSDNHMATKSSALQNDVQKTKELLRVNAMALQDSDSEKKKVSGSLSKDKPKRIIFAKQNVDGKMCFLVEWEPRKDGTYPNPSFQNNNEFKYKYPFLVIDHYESKITFVNDKKHSLTNGEKD